MGVIFETLNERGRGLSDLEKTKNYLLYLARNITDGRGEKLAEIINNSWAEIFKNLAGQPSDADDQLLRSHWLATVNPIRKDWKRIASIKKKFDRSKYISGATRIVITNAENHNEHDDVWQRMFEDLQDYITGLRNCSFYLKEMFDSSATFDSFDLMQRHEARRKSDALNRSGVVALYRPLLLAARLKYPRNGEFYVKLVDLCEKYSARVFIIRQRRANAGEPRLIRLANDLYLGKKSPDTILNAVSSTLWRYASDTEVSTTMESVSENWYVRRGHKYFLYEYELAIRAHGQELPPLGYFTDTAKEQKTTEHILPQHPKPEDKCWWDRFSKEQHATLVHSLGNLSLTYDNSSYSRKCFDKKRGKALSPGELPSICYAQATLMQEQLLAQYLDWTPEIIAIRQKEFASWALKRWHIDAPSLEEIEQEDVEIESEGSEDEYENNENNQ